MDEQTLDRHAAGQDDGSADGLGDPLADIGYEAAMPALQSGLTAPGAPWHGGY